VELNTKGRYAVMAMADLAKAALEQPSVPLSAIADRQQISLAYLEQLFVKLRRAQLIESERGRSGGYRLARPASEISIADILLAVEEKTDMTRCGQDAGEPCIAGKRCLTHDLWDALSAHIDTFMMGVTLDQVVDGSLRKTKRTTVEPAAALFSGGIWPR
jgi:Rrf2 family transcriptional regulator, iron-sulfur cluster assembly transcription factor